MSYLEQTDPKLLNDINYRKEFAIYSNDVDAANAADAAESTAPKNGQSIVPRFLLENVVGKEHGLTLHSYQKFVGNFMNPNTPYTRLFLQWSPGMGKTIAALSLSLKFINYYNKEQTAGSDSIGSIWIIGFTENIFRSDLVKFPEFGFVTEAELKTLSKLKELAHQGSTYDIEKINEIKMAINRRLNNRKGNGFFKFIGYKALFNRLFLSRDKDIVLTGMLENQLARLILDGTVILNKELMNDMKNSLIICDEIHNVYNSAEKNNWGVALQTILNYDSTIRTIFLSATPFNNSPTELVDLLNLITPRKDFPEFKTSDFFTKTEEIIESKIHYLQEILAGRVSFITNNDSRYFPAKGYIGESIPGIDYLKFIRCPMSKFHYNTYKQVIENTGWLGPDSRYLTDYVLPDPTKNNPWDSAGIYKTTSIRGIYTNTPSSWRNKFKLFYNSEIDVMSGDILNVDNGHLDKISYKYYKITNDIIKLIDKHSGKIFIYHNVIHMSGVLFIGEVLKANGFISEIATSNDNTRCSLCGKPRKNHKKEQLISGGDEQTNNYHKSFIDIPGYNPGIVNYVSVGDEHIDIVIDPILQETTEVAASCFDSILKLNKDIVIRSSMVDSDKLTTPLGPNIYNLFHDYLFITRKTPQEWKHIQPAVGRFIGKIMDLVASRGGNKKHKDRSAKRDSAKRDIADTHRYLPARYTLVHSDAVSRKQINKNIDAFNSITNSWGEHIAILVGGKIMKESINLMGVQHLFIAGRPDNIPTMLQINGRAIRTNSHIMLPEENRLVNISIYTSCLPDGKLSYEELKYKEKIKSFKVIQQLELILHEVAIDKFINYSVVFQQPSQLQKKQHYELDILPYKIGKNIKYSLSELNLETFNAYYGDEEIREIKFIIKKIFIELSPVWKYEDLFSAVKSYNKYNKQHRRDMSLISENNFMLVLDSLLVKDNDKYVEPQIQQLNRASDQLYSKLKNPLDKFIYMAGEQIKGIVHIGEYYMLMPMNTITNEITIDVEMPYRMSVPTKEKSMQIKNYLLHDMKNSYNDKKIKFIMKWGHVAIRNLEMAICDFGTSFHREFAEECIKYIFDMWTDPKQTKSPNHIFYIKMIYYYDLRKVIVWAHTVSDKMFAQYKEWAIPIVQKLQRGIKIDKIKDAHLNSTSGLINLLKTSINKNNTAWVSTGMINDFNSKTTRSLDMFDGTIKKKGISTRVNADDLPIGHFIGKIPRFYNPNKDGWNDDMSYMEYSTHFKENNIIVGYDDKSKTGINVKFKLRNPIQNIKQYLDTRQIEKGSICGTKSKQHLKQIAKLLGIEEKNIYKNSVEDLCMKIRTRLIYYELKARSSGSNIKYFYFLHEIKPETMII